MSKEAMKLALEALEKLVRFESDSWELGSCRVAGQAIKALREALAEQPAQQALDKMAENARELGLDYEPAQQEPVAYLCENAVGHQYFRWKKPSSEYKPIALYTSPQAQREWVGLTDEEVKECFESVPTQDCQNYEHWRSLCARNIETKLREKNT